MKIIYYNKNKYFSTKHFDHYYTKYIFTNYPGSSIVLSTDKRKYNECAPRAE